MREHGLAAADFPGEGRVDAAQIEARLDARARGADAAPRPHGAPDAEPVELTSARVSEVRAVSAAHREAVPSTVAIALPCAALASRLEELAAEVGPVSLLEVAVFEVGKLLADWPDLNGYFADGRAYAYRSIGVGFALNAGRALRVPVVAANPAASLCDTVRSMRELALRYMRNELTVADLAGGTFTVTDLSGYGVVQFVPVLNVRQAAILGLCAERPGTATRDLVLTFDHRLADGMRAAQFLGALAARLVGRQA
jgi:pyruvate/2-oxoglutarate dehydrogenase complex dihydrolipoamide acyltransferase (E2) component